MYTPPYRIAFQALAQRMHFLDHCTPEQALARWQAVVEELRLEEPGPAAGLDNELDRIREPLETFLVADELLLFPEHALFSRSILAIDTIFNDLTVASQQAEPERSDFRWWKNRLPKCGLINSKEQGIRRSSFYLRWLTDCYCDVLRATS